MAQQIEKILSTREGLAAGISALIVFLGIDIAIGRALVNRFRRPRLGPDAQTILDQEHNPLQLPPPQEDR